MPQYPTVIVSRIVWTRRGLGLWHDEILRMQQGGYQIESVIVSGMLLRWLCVAVLTWTPRYDQSS